MQETNQNFEDRESEAEVQGQNQAAPAVRTPTLREILND